MILIDGAPMTKHPLYSVWSGMRSRCYRKRAAAFARYGGRGIKICAGWLGSFEKFVSDMGPRPDKRYTSGKRIYSIDRMNNDHGYDCGTCDDCTARGARPNCRWATHDEQARNKTTRLDKPLCVRLAWLGAGRYGFACVANRKLRDWIAASGITTGRDVEEAFGYPVHSVMQWVSRTRPDTVARLVIQRITGIPFDDWLTNSEYRRAYGLTRAQRAASADGKAA